MSTIDCAGFARWLDEGCAPEVERAMLGHAAQCAGCAAALEAMRELDAALSRTPAAPRGFTDAVMARVARTRQAPLRSPGWADAAPWWLSILQQPAVVIASALAALVIWRAQLLLAAAAAAAEGLAESVRAYDSRVAAWIGALPALPAPAASGAGWHPSPTFATGLALGLTPLLLFGALALSDWVSRSVTRRLRAS